VPSKDESRNPRYRSNSRDAFVKFRDSTSSESPAVSPPHRTFTSPSPALYERILEERSDTDADVDGHTADNNPDGACDFADSPVLTKEASVDDVITSSSTADASSPVPPALSDQESEEGTDIDVLESPPPETVPETQKPNNVEPVFKTIGGWTVVNVADNVSAVPFSPARAPSGESDDDDISSLIACQARPAHAEIASSGSSSSATLSVLSEDEGSLGAQEKHASHLRVLILDSAERAISVPINSPSKKKKAPAKARIKIQLPAPDDYQNPCSDRDIPSALLPFSIQGISAGISSVPLCFCRKPWTGAMMVECDNEECAIGWFHYLCLTPTEKMNSTRYSK
jgi:hypothetical protein